MNRALIVACVAAVIATGCSGAASTTDGSAELSNDDATSVGVVDTPVVDATLDNYITATTILVQMQPGSLEESIADFESAQDQLAQMATTLRSGIAGVPVETSQAIIEALDRIDISMTALVDCFRSSETVTCDAESTVANEDANALGVEVAALVPFGSRSEEEFIATMEELAGGSSADTDSAIEAPSDTDTGVASESVAQSNAREMASDYLDYSSFSRQGLIEQLEFEGFSTADATYGADSTGADWYEQAALKAQEYLDYSAFSRDGLIEQLVFEGFSRDEAVYGVNAVGL